MFTGSAAAAMVQGCEGLMLSSGSNVRKRPKEGTTLVPFHGPWSSTKMPTVVVSALATGERRRFSPWRVVCRCRWGIELVEELVAEHRRPQADRQTFDFANRSRLFGAIVCMVRSDDVDWDADRVSTPNGKTCPRCDTLEAVASEESKVVGVKNAAPVVVKTPQRYS
jgi:hypothetical protein